MFAKNLSVIVAAAFLVAGIGLNLVSCQQNEEVAEAEPESEFWFNHIFGNSFKEPSPIIARVAGLDITQNMLDLRFEETPTNIKSRFSGPGWEKRFLRFMVEEALLTKGAVDAKLYLNPMIAQQLISTRRSILSAAFQNIEVIKGLTPTEEQIQAYYEQNKEDFMSSGTIRARHISCKDEETAWEVYNRSQMPGKAGSWPYLVAEFSTNAESKKQDGELGYFSKNGLIPAIPYYKLFAKTIWDWEIGVNEPARIGGEWHVVEIMSRNYARPMALAEVRDRILESLQPILREEAVENYLRQAKNDQPIEYFGSYRAGQGRTDKELFEVAWYGKTPEQQVDSYKMLIEDFPESEFADDALFMIANVYLDTWNEVPFASRYLNRLLSDYPNSELAEDARFLLENMGKPEFVKPTSIDELRRSVTED